MDLLGWIAAIREATKRTGAEAKKWTEWAAENPTAAYLMVEAWALAIDDRAELLQGRKFVLWRRQHRVDRLRRLSKSLSALGTMLKQTATTKL